MNKYDAIMFLETVDRQISLIEQIAKVSSAVNERHQRLTHVVSSVLCRLSSIEAQLFGNPRSCPVKDCLSSAMIAVKECLREIEGSSEVATDATIRQIEEAKQILGDWISHIRKIEQG